MKPNIRKYLTNLKNNKIVLFYIWTEFVRLNGLRKLKNNNDFEAINELYYQKSGRYPDLKNPVLFSEKMQWLKLFYRNPIMSIAADKYEVRGLVEKKGFSNTLNNLHAVFEDVNDINLDDLPKQFVLKASHGSGWNLIVKDKSNIKWFWWKKILASWLKHNIFWNGREWVYKNINPRLVCEEYLSDESGYLIDYKFHCFNGVPTYIQVNNGRGKTQHSQNFYDLEWNFLPFYKDVPSNKTIEIKKPKKLSNMIEMATAYASEFPYVRVDFYQVNNKIIFGELTFFPASGMPDFEPHQYDKVWGNLLILPNKNNE